MKRVEEFNLGPESGGVNLGPVKRVEEALFL